MGLRSPDQKKLVSPGNRGMLIREVDLTLLTVDDAAGCPPGHLPALASPTTYALTHASLTPDGKRSPEWHTGSQQGREGLDTAGLFTSSDGLRCRFW